MGSNFPSEDTLTLDDENVSLPSSSPEKRPIDSVRKPLGRLNFASLDCPIIRSSNGEETFRASLLGVLDESLSAGHIFEHSNSNESIDRSAFMCGERHGESGEVRPGGAIGPPKTKEPSNVRAVTPPLALEGSVTQGRFYTERKRAGSPIKYLPTRWKTSPEPDSLTDNVFDFRATADESADNCSTWHPFCVRPKCYPTTQSDTDEEDDSGDSSDRGSVPE